MSNDVIFNLSQIWLIGRVGLEFIITLQVGVERDQDNALASRTDRVPLASPSTLRRPPRVSCHAERHEPGDDCNSPESL